VPSHSATTYNKHTEHNRTNIYKKHTLNYELVLVCGQKTCKLLASVVATFKEDFPSLYPWSIVASAIAFLMLDRLACDTRYDAAAACGLKMGKGCASVLNTH
jgi:hypothetical protein